MTVRINSRAGYIGDTPGTPRHRCETLRADYWLAPLGDGQMNQPRSSAGKMNDKTPMVGCA
jgi:hypothetical protein